jgi:hypothetical protein
MVGREIRPKDDGQVILLIGAVHGSPDRLGESIDNPERPVLFLLDDSGSGTDQNDPIVRELFYAN